MLSTVATFCDTCGCPGKTQGATFYRTIAPCERCEDPLLGGKVEWDKWQPKTGDSVWATMIGPLNSLYLANSGAIPRFQDFASAPGEVQLAISILPALLALQSAAGSMWAPPAPPYPRPHP